MFLYRDKAVVLTYHNIDDKTLSDITISPEHFKSHLKILSDDGFNVISMRRLIDARNGTNELPHNAVVITFDDGLKGVYDYAFPQLMEMGLPASCFLITSRCKETGYNVNGFEYLKNSHIREMHQSGIIDVQSHTHDCHRLRKNRLGKEKGILACRVYNASNRELESLQDYEVRIKEDMSVSRKMIHELTDTFPDVLCFPFGHYNSKVVKAANEIGFKYFASCNYGYNSIAQSDNIIKRINAGVVNTTSFGLKEEILSCVNEGRIGFIRRKMRLLKKRLKIDSILNL